jgi:recombination protein RecR
MNTLPISLQKLIQNLQRIPGLGPKSSARIAMYLLKSPIKFTKDLGRIIESFRDEIKYCQICHNLSSTDICPVCDDTKRDKTLICIVEDPLDIVAFEEGTEYQGVYHVLGGVISPVNGVGPEDLTIDDLLKRIRNNVVKELIIATNPNMEGEATAMYIKSGLDKLKILSIKVTRLARGLPTGADLEYADKLTLSRAFEGRTKY